MSLKNMLTKYPTYLLVLAFVLSSIAISIKGRNGKVHLILHNYPVLITLLVLLSSFLVVYYIQIKNRSIESLSEQIRTQSELSTEAMEPLIPGLSDRQKEVYELIISGKTNKEIMSELFIEQSTLKSHINQIYKKLHVRSRSELKTKLKS